MDSGVKYHEFAELVFAKSENGVTYFDATKYVLGKGSIKQHNIKDFEIGFHFWIAAVRDAYSLSRQETIVRDSSTGHLLVEESLSIVFLAFIEPEFGIYLLERMDEMLINGCVLSDTALLTMTSSRFKLLFDLYDLEDVQSCMETICNTSEGIE